LSLTESLLHPDAGLTGLMALSEGERFDTPRRTSRHGYNVIEWTSGDLNYRASPTWMTKNSRNSRL